MGWQVTKTYGHDLGLSCCFRQWGASSHCRFLHGYALSFSFTFERRDAGLDALGTVGLLDQRQDRAVGGLGRVVVAQGAAQTCKIMLRKFPLR